MEKCVAIFQVVWYEVVAVSKEFLKILEDMPEASTASWVCVGNRTIEGPKRVLLANSMKQIEQQLPAIIAKLTDKKDTHLRVIKKSTNCYECMEEREREPKKEIFSCTHGRPTVNEAFDIDIKKFLASVKSS